MSNFNHDEALFMAACINAGCEYHSYAPAVGGNCAMWPTDPNTEFEMPREAWCP